MTITAKNIAENIRVQQHAPVMSCLENMIWFNKQAAKLINAPCKICFNDDSGEWCIFKDLPDGFEIRQHGDRFTITTRARVLTRKLEAIFQVSLPKFEIKTTADDKIFRLKIINQ